MRILLDECVPRPLRRELPDHEVRTVVEMGWAGKQNGELLRLLAAENFAVFLTTDQNLRYQQNLRGLRVESDLHQKIDRRFRDAGIVIAFPQRDLHVRSVDRLTSARLRLPAEQQTRLAIDNTARE